MKKILLSLLGVAAFVAIVKVVGFSHAQQCTHLEALAKETLAAAKTCSSDDECVVQQLQCPFECFNAVNRDGRKRALDAVEEYTDNCMLTCPPCPAVRENRPRCHQGICQL